LLNFGNSLYLNLFSYIFDYWINLDLTLFMFLFMYETVN